MKAPDSRLSSIGKRLYYGRALFSTYRDFLTYLILCARLSRNRGRQVKLGIRSLGDHRVFCRAGTTDAGVLWSTFHEQFHLPDVPLQQDSCILDLGANVGFTVAHFASLYPRARVFGVEMDQDNYELALQNTNLFGPRCKIFHAAVSSIDGRVAYGGQREDGLRLLQGKSAATKNAKWVRSFCMNTLIKELELDQIDFLKMDIEGAEFDLFRGALEWLNLVSAMKIEFHAPNDVALIEAALQGHGFECARDQHHWSALTARRHAVQR